MGISRAPGTGMVWAHTDYRRPAVLVLLGKTAAASLLGREVRVTRERGLVQAPELAARERATGEFMADWGLVVTDDLEAGRRVRGMESREDRR